MAGTDIMILRAISLFLVLATFVCEATPIPPNRLPPNGWWNPGVVGTNGLTYRVNGCFVPSFAPTNIINVKNFGAVGDGTNDDTAAIQGALNSSGNAVCYFPPGTYKVTSTLSLGNPNYPWAWSSIILRGAGPTNTFIKGYGTSGPIIQGSGGGIDAGRYQYLAVAAHRGDTTITLRGWDSLFQSESIGIISELNANAGSPWGVDPNVQAYEERSRCQMLHVIGWNSSAQTITFDTPLYMDMDTNCQFSIGLGSDDSVIGIEDLSVENVGGPATGASIDTIKLIGLRNSWVRNCETKNATGYHIRLQQCMDCTIEGCYIHGYWSGSGSDWGGGNSVYGAGLYGQSTDNLVINNHFDHCRHAMPVENGSIGNVFAYNYDSNPINEGEENTDYLMGDEIMHGVSSWNLWEGNIACDFNMDDVLGGSVNNVGFRLDLTRVSHLNTAVKGWGYDIQIYNFSTSLVGSVLNAVGYNPSWRVGAPDGNGNYPSTNSSQWADNGGGNYFPDPTGTAKDPAPTLYLHGVVDLESNVTYWAATNTDHTLPNSLWLATKPLIMGTNYAWPGNGPDISGYTNTLPAFNNFFGADALTNIVMQIYSLIVTNGMGSSSYPLGSLVSIAATPPPGFVFSYWSGNISTVANTNMASTSVSIPATNITVTANYVPATLTSGLIAWYKFDDGSGVTSADSSGNGNDGALNNSPAWITNGIIGGALQFNGTNQYVSVASSTSLNPSTAITISYWVKTTNPLGMPLQKGNFNEFYSYIGRSFHIYTSSGDLEQYAASTNLNNGNWHLFTATWRTGDVIKIYVDGALDTNSLTTLSGTINSQTGGMTIGAGSSSTYFFNGTLDDVRIYNRALAANEIQNIYGAASTTQSTLPPPPGKLFVLPP
jgi:Concanavalin A-like lectin/glucanases superfamily/Pectate lyase superfamily protein/Divergent InlB B-repeat domain